MRTAQSSVPRISGRPSHSRPASSLPLAFLSRRTPSGLPDTSGASADYPSAEAKSSNISFQPRSIGLQ